MKKLLFAILTLAALNGAAKSDKPEIRAVWIPDPSHTSLMHTYKNIVNGVAKLDSIGINMLYVCVQAKNEVGFRSKVYTKNTTYKTPEQGYMFQKYMKDYGTGLKSKSNDPLKDLIAEAHKRGMKVVFWFEYGFMATHGVTPADHPILAKNPQWQSRNSKGEQANYNQTDYYLNSYNKDYQKFILDLIAESLKMYPNVDGVQGDDRMPAAPRNSGYDDYTSKRYLAETGSLPPADFNDSAWVKWRLAVLNSFAEELNKTVKKFGKNKLVCFSPNPYPWCEEMLMQDWPAWLKSRVVDILSVQCYRFSVDSYKSTIDEVVRYVEQSGSSRSILNPGIILLTSTHIPADVLKAQMEYNRELGVNGDAFFWIDAFKEPSIREVVTNIYKRK